MSLRVYTRRFDWGEARRRHAEGEAIRLIAESFGVTYNAVYRVVVPGEIERQVGYQREWMARGRCDDCGGPMNNLSRTQGSTRCNPCAAIALATSAREGELRCVTCREWKPDDGFPRSRGEKYGRRGRHPQCRVCQTIARQAYRERHKVPCVDCGSPALPPNEKGHLGRKEPRCKPCTEARQRTPEARQAARERALQAIGRKVDDPPSGG